MRGKQKGQGLVEFAFVLPLLLLLLLGIIEGARVIWAYVTVQQAAREAARYAVTGRPYVPEGAISTFEQTCLGNPTDIEGYDGPGVPTYDPTNNEPDPVAVSAQPWLCSPEQRAQAIEQIAFSQANALNISERCSSYYEKHQEINGNHYTECANTPSAFGVLVQGQVTTQTITGTLVIAPDPVDDNAGQEGLSVQVSTFYNLQMLTPVYDAIMGGNFIRLEGRAQLQNEGLDKTAGIEPPPGLDPPPTPVGSGAITGTVTAKINPTNGIKFSQSAAINVHLEDHDESSLFDVHLLPSGGTPYTICQDVVTDLSGSADRSCPLSSLAIPPGFYDLFSTIDGATSPAVATYPDQIEITAGGAPKIRVKDEQDEGDVWAANSETFINLQFHPTADAPFTVKLFDPEDNEIAVVATGAAGVETEDIPWMVTDVEDKGGTVCDQTSGKFCMLKSYDSGGAEVAQTSVRINQPKIVMSAPSEGDAYKRGETVYLFLRSHTPERRYNINIKGASDNISFDTLDTNAVGDTTTPIVWPIPAQCGKTDLWGDGDYDITSHPLGDSTIQIADEVFEINTPLLGTPYLTIDGGKTWNAGSDIVIRVWEHTKEVDHYLEFDGNRIPVSGSTDDTFKTGGCGEALVSYTIPADTPKGDYKLASFLDSNDEEQADLTVTVLDKPTIRVVEGDKVLPDQTITIELSSHQPNTSYRVFYADKQLFGLLTDGDGEFSRTYDLKAELPRLPKTPPPDLTNPTNYGIAYEMNSQTVAETPSVVATTELTLQAADLVVTKVEVPPIVPPNTTVPVTITVVNTRPVGINQWVDFDLYLNPQPVAPSYLQGYNFPGDIKYWKNTIGPNETFVITHEFDITEVDLQTIYGYADTSGKVFEGEQAGQVNNPNNLGNAPFAVDCGTGAFIDNFDGTYAAGADIPDYSVKRFGTANNAGYGTQVSGGSLSLNSSGRSTWGSNDDDSDRGHLFFYKTLSVPSLANGLDVELQVKDIEIVGGTSKAGIEIRNDPNDSSSTKLTFEVSRASDTDFRVRLAGREEGGNMGGPGYDTVKFPSGGPVWLRVSRLPGTNTFNVYYRQTSDTPPAIDADAATRDTWWSVNGNPYKKITLDSMADQVYVGMFNASYSSNEAGTAELDNFSVYPVADPSICPASAAPNEDFPPGLQVCSDLVEDRSFENAFSSPWKITSPNAFFTSDGGAHSGVRKIRGVSGDDALPPAEFGYYQKFTMPDWVISTTTRFDLNFYKKVRSYIDPANQAKDKVFAVVSTSPTRGAGTQLTTPVEIVNGQSSAPKNVLEEDWLQIIKVFPVAAGINLEDYAEKELYVHIYNDSNTKNACPDVGCRTHFDFDDMNLRSCTTQPLPQKIDTRLTGKVILNFSDGTFGELPYVKVWAYSANDNQVYETFSIQGGEFNFYNLPATAEGTRYTIFAQYILTQGSQIETLSADATVELTTSNSDTNPARTTLNLFTLAPLQ